MNKSQELGSGPSNSHSPLPVSLFALIIGIDNYVDCRKLSGAVADAKALKDNLEALFDVPSVHIRTLFDGEATRDAIIEAFRALRDDDRIHKGDPIVVFYAGHGSELSPPHAWGAHEKIQCLIPCDFKSVKIDLRGKPANIHPIPDRTIGSLIDDIAKVKGDNITVILDCCHSASGTRVENEAYVPRTVTIDHTIPAELDSDIWEGRSGKIPENLVHKGTQSHVLLAACGQNELAYEYDGRGQFTTALLSTFKDAATSNLTYDEIVNRIHLTTQNPHCEGTNRHRTLFNTKASTDKQIHHSVRVIQSCRYLISAGLADGVSQGVEFTLYSNDRRMQHVVVVDDSAMIEDFQTTVTLPVYLANDWFAKLTRVGPLPFYLSASARETFLGKGSNHRLVEKLEEVKLKVEVDNQGANFSILDKRVNEFGLTQIPQRVDLDRISRILDAAAHYYWYLDLMNKTPHTGSKNQVNVDFYPLMHDYDDYGIELYVPIEPGLCQRGPESDKVVIDFVVDPQAIYGIKIINNTSQNLYLNAFLFNNTSFSIEPYYTQTSAGNPDAPLKANGVFTIGYGSEGILPFSYSLEEDQDVDVSYLKIFFATRPIDLSNVAQKSPFVINGREEVVNGNARKARVCPSPATQTPSVSVDAWFTVEIPVVQRRA